MPATPKRINFEDIKNGDKIRIVDVRDVSVSEHRGFELITETGFNFLAESPQLGTKRTFQLLERQHTPIPDKLGALIEINGERFVLVQDTYAPTDMWVTVLGGHKLDPGRVQMIADEALGFKVIA